MVMDGIFTRNPSLEGTPHEVKQVKDTQTKRHIVHFLADPKLKASLAKLQNGSSTFYLRLGGTDRKTIMARDPLVVAAEEAAELKSRIERALAKAIEASNPDLVVPVATPDHQQQQQPGNNTIGYTTNKSNPNPNPDTSHNPGTGPSETPRETEFARVWKLMEVERVQLENEQKHQQEQLKRLQHHQQQQVAQFDNERLLLQRGSTTGSTTPIQQQLQQQQGKANSFSIIKYLTYNRDPSPQGVVKGRVASFEAPSAVSPPHGVDMNSLASGLPPPADYESSDSSSSEAVSSRTKARLENSTGSAKVDALKGMEDLGDSDMEGQEGPEEDLELYALARTGNELEDGMGEDS
jgi:hypothetical protein